MHPETDIQHKRTHLGFRIKQAASVSDMQGQTKGAITVQRLETFEITNSRQSPDSTKQKMTLAYNVSKQQKCMCWSVTRLKRHTNQQYTAHK